MLASTVAMLAADGGDGKGAGVEVYTSLGCKFCVKAKLRLRELRVPYAEVRVGQGEERAALVARAAGRSSVPQIFIGGQHLGGCDDLFREDSSGELQARLDAAGVQRLPEGAAQDESYAVGGDGAGLTAEELSPKDGCLNHVESVAASTRVTDLAEELQRRSLLLYDTFVSAKGVDFGRMRCSAALADYVALTSALRPPEVLDEVAKLDIQAKTALFVNLYNCLTLHGSVAVPPGPSDPDARGPFFSGTSGVRYMIGGLPFSLDDIEHGILRCSPSGDKRSFSKDDLRTRAMLPASSLPDPRIHFALNCGAKSCPPIKLFAAENLEEGLSLAAQAFCESEVACDPSTMTVSMSKILFWYGGDFAPTEKGVVERVKGFLPANSALRIAIEDVLARDAKGEGTLAVSYNAYDWSQNAA